MPTYTLDGIDFALKAPFDFEFLRQYGRVFCVFDQNDSGNISFGVAQGDTRRFVKVAGAQTLRGIAPDEAVRNLRSAMPAYQALRHPCLIDLLHHGPIPGGYAAVFDWTPGECLHAHWTFDQFPKYTHPQSPFYRWRQLPLEKRLRSLMTIFEFHAHVARRGYVAIDFYDGSVLYDFETDATRVCDIDLYAPAPYINRMGRLWGSSRFMAPEEFALGAAIDETTNVFTMGATAFVLLGGEGDRSLAAWQAPPALHRVAARATSADREKRHPSVRAFIEDWVAAIP